MARRKTAVTNNWIKEETLNEYKKKGVKALNKIKAKMKGKKYKLISHPSGNGMIEVEINQ